MASQNIDKSALLNSLLINVSELPYRNDGKLDALRRRAKMILSRIFGAESQYVKDMEDLRFYPSVAFSGMSDSFYAKAWASGKSGFENLLNTCLEEVRLECTTSTEAIPDHASQASKNIREVFVVHGHDEEMKQSVARVLEKLDLRPIILHEKPDQGRTVIEKFIEHSQVQFAVVLFSPDDMGHSKTASPDTAKHRARQNVVLELGFFLGKLGRDSVVVLYKKVPNFEMPTDYSGVLFKAYEGNGWQFELVRELNAKGFKVDANKLI